MFPGRETSVDSCIASCCFSGAYTSRCFLATSAAPTKRTSLDVYKKHSSNENGETSAGEASADFSFAPHHVVAGVS